MQIEETWPSVVEGFASKSPVRTPAARTRELITNIAREHRVGYHEIVGPNRHRRVVVARCAALKALSTAKPHLSTPQLGAIFGLDHSTVLYSLGRLRSRRPAHLRQVAGAEVVG